MSSEIAVTSHDGVMEITFARPAKLNAMTAEMYGAAADAIAEFNGTGALKALVFSGAGAHFCAGNDLDEFLTIYSLTPGSPWRRFLEALAGVEKPVLAAVQGRAVGIGLTMLLHCDFVYAEPNARLSAPFVKLGLCPEAASSLLLTERVGRLRAMDVFALGRELDAQTAFEWNLVTAIAEPGTAREMTLNAARTLAESDPVSLSYTRRLVVGDTSNVRARIHAECNAFIRLLSTEATRAGLSALLEARRKPDQNRIQGGST